MNTLTDLQGPSMQFVRGIQKEFVIVHKDGTSRVQTVNKQVTQKELPNDKLKQTDKGINIKKVQKKEVIHH